MTYFLSAFLILNWEPQEDTEWYWIYQRTTEKTNLDLRPISITGHQILYSATNGMTSAIVDVDVGKINYFYVTAVCYDLTQSEPILSEFFIFEDLK
jgi:hypothetical protein